MTREKFALWICDLIGLLACFLAIPTLIILAAVALGVPTR